MRPQSLAVIGLGAIGGSLAWQSRLAGVASVIGYSPERSDSVQALKSGALHDIADSPERAVQGADLVVLATPPRAVLELLGSLRPHLAPGALVTDVASIKAPVVARARVAGLAAQFAGSHPFAGTHVAGWAGARPDRFVDAVVYVSSTGPDGDRAAREVANFWQSVLGAQAILIDATDHDVQLAWTSHLPQAVAGALARALSRAVTLRGASFGTGMRDTTRLAASPTDMWTDIFLMNQGPVREALEKVEGELAELRDLLERGDRPGLHAYLEDGALFRRRLDGDADLPPGAVPRR